MQEENKVIAFSAKEQEIVNLMVTLGVQKNKAEILVFISKMGEATSRNIEDTVDIKQSEVSIILRELRDKGWLSSRSVKKPGKGRPVLHHRLKFPLIRVAKEVEDEKKKEIEEIKRKIARLKGLAK